MRVSIVILAIAALLAVGWMLYKNAKDRRRLEKELDEGRGDERQERLK